MSRLLCLTFAATVCMGLSATGALAAADNNKSFLKDAMQGDNSEMALGKTAERKGASSGIREFGRVLYVDHGKAKVATLPVAKAHGLAPDSRIAPIAKAEAAKLAKLSGPAFDREFARYMVMDHKNDIAEFEKQARSGDRQTADLARKTLPTLKKHLKMAEQLAR